jgi:hypothetical protein
MRRVAIVQRTPIYLPFVDFNVSDTWNGAGGVPIPENFRTLIKLSDTTNWRHTGTNWLIILRSYTIVSKGMAGSSFDVSVGVVLATSLANVTIAYLEPMSLGINSDDPQRLSEDRNFFDFPLSLRPTSPAGGLLFGVAASTTIVETAITNATPIANAAGVAPVPPAVGDLVMKVFKTSMQQGDTCRIRHFIHYRGA